MTRIGVQRYTAGGSPRRFVNKVRDRVGREIGTRRPSWFYDGRVLGDDESVATIRRMLEQSEPTALTRLGATEQGVLLRYIRQVGITDVAPRTVEFPSYLRDDLSHQAGVNPPTDAVLTQFCELYLGCLEEIDGLGVWFHRAERMLVHKRIEPTTPLFPLDTFDPLRVPGGWTPALDGKRVCVVHPFATSIVEQYGRRQHLMRDDRILPEFDLVVVPAVQAHGGLPAGVGSWFDALTQMTDAIVATGAEIVLIGAGAFGLPLAINARRAGMRALHLGGSLQLLFGISGRRWDDVDYVQRQRTDAWIRPSAQERPADADRVEGGCYW